MLSYWTADGGTDCKFYFFISLRIGSIGLVNVLKMKTRVCVIVVEGKDSFMAAFGEREGWIMVLLERMFRSFSGGVIC